MYLNLYNIVVAFIFNLDNYNLMINSWIVMLKKKAFLKPVFFNEK